MSEPVNNDTEANESQTAIPKYREANDATEIELLPRGRRSCWKPLLIIGILIGGLGFGFYKLCIEMPGGNRTGNVVADDNDGRDECPPETVAAERERYVTKLSPEIGERNLIRLDALKEAADWILSFAT